MHQMETKSRIIKTANHLFATQGFAGVSVRKIAKEAGVNVAAVNYHFDNKAKLYSTIIKEAKERISREAMAINIEELSVTEVALCLFEVFVKNAKQLRHAFSMLICDLPSDGFEFDLEENEKGAPGEALLLASLEKEYGSDLDHLTKEWVVSVIFSKTIHMALLADTRLIKGLCRGDEERFAPERVRSNIKNTVNAVLAYLDRHSP